MTPICKKCNKKRCEPAKKNEFGEIIYYRTLCWQCRHKRYVIKPSQRNKKYHQKLRNEVLTAYGNKCECCGETERFFLTIDHIDNNGAEHKRGLGGSAYFYCWLRKNNYPKGYRILCYNCNCGRQLNNHICPHKMAESSNI